MALQTSFFNIIGCLEFSEPTAIRDQFGSRTSTRRPPAVSQTDLSYRQTAAGRQLTNLMGDTAEEKAFDVAKTS